MAPEGEAAHGEGQSAAHGLSHGRIVCEAVAAPVYRELLSACGGTSSKKYCLLLALYFLQKIEHSLVVQVCIEIVHRMGIASVMVNHIHRNPLTEVGLEAVHATVKDRAELICVPFHRIRIREVHETHTSLPVVGLPYASAVRTLQQITILHTLTEEVRTLSDVRIDPDTDLQTLVMIPLQSAADIREALFVPLKIAPVECFHPETVKVEYGKRNIALQHTIDKGAGGLLVVVGRKGGGQPQPEGPCRRQGRTSRQSRVLVQDLLRCRSIEEVIGDGLTRYGEAHILYFLAGHFKGYIIGAVHQHTISPVGHVERNALVGDLGCCAAVLVPGIYHLSVLYECGKPLTKSIDTLSYGQRELIHHIRLILLGQVIVCRKHGAGLTIPADAAEVAEIAGGQHLSVRLKRIRELLPVHTYLHLSSIQKCFFLRNYDLCILYNALCLFELRKMIVISFVVPCFHGDHSCAACHKLNGDGGHIQRISPLSNSGHRAHKPHAAGNTVYRICLCGK